MVLLIQPFVLHRSYVCTPSRSQSSSLITDLSVFVRLATQSLTFKILVQHQWPLQLRTALAQNYSVQFLERDCYIGIRPFPSGLSIEAPDLTLICDIGSVLVVCAFMHEYPVSSCAMLIATAVGGQNPVAK